MLHHRPLFAWLLAIFAVLVLAPGAAVASNGPAASAKAKERAYGKHCGAKKGKAARSGARAKCLKAMAKLDKNPSLSPAKACRALSKKKAKGERRSAYARCVSEGAKLLKAKRRAAADADSSTAPAADDPSDPPEGQDAVDDVGSTPAHELVPEDYLSADELDPDF